MTDPIDPREVRDDNREGRADFREGRADAREGSASKRDERGGNREENAADRDERADQREVGAVGREAGAIDREVGAVDRESRAVNREGNAVSREGRAVGLSNDLFKLVRNILVPLVIVLILMSGVNFYRTVQVGQSVEHLEEMSEETTRTAIQTSNDLHTALEQASSGPTSEAVLQALRAIARIELFLCKGPCPEGT